MGEEEEPGAIQGQLRGMGGRSRAVVRWTRELWKAGKDGGQELTPFHLGVGHGGLGECGVGRGVPVEEGKTGRAEDFLEVAVNQRRSWGETLRLRGVRTEE